MNCLVMAEEDVESGSVAWERHRAVAFLSAVEGEEIKVTFRAMLPAGARSEEKDDGAPPYAGYLEDLLEEVCRQHQKRQKEGSAWRGAPLL